MIIKNVSNKYATRERVANLVTLFQMQDWEVYVRLVNGLWWTQGFEYNDNNEIVAYDFENLNDFGGFDLNPCESGFFHHSTSNRFVYHISARGVRVEINRLNYGEVISIDILKNMDGAKTPYYLNIHVEENCLERHFNCLQSDLYWLVNFELINLKIKGNSLWHRDVPTTKTFFEMDFQKVMELK